MSAHRILVVEDDHGLREIMARGLREEGFNVVTAATGATALARAQEEPEVHAVVLDIGLPDSDGRDVCQALRAHGKLMPVVFLTARGNVTDRLSGFAAGGDDYLAKPFTFAELVARLRAVLRRSGAEASSGLYDLRLDPVAHTVQAAGSPVSLSPTEFRLLARLFATPEAVVRRHELLASGWAAGAAVSDNTLDQYLARLRRKLRETGSARTIHTMRGVGYRIT